MKDFNKYFIVGTNSDALHDTMNGMVVGELVLCKGCRHRIVTASIEHNDGEVTKYYMCNNWHRPTDPAGFCHMAKRARYSSD